MNRRAFLKRMGAAAAMAGWAPGLWTPARARALAHGEAGIADVAGTTLESSIMRPPGPGYLPLASGPGWPLVTREELAAGQPGRHGRRRPLAAFVHLTDVHVIDAQSPARVEFTDRFGPPFESAFRAQETLTTQVGSAMVDRINAIGKGPVTGRPFDCCVSTGDNIDNQQLNETDWFITLLDGGPITPDSGLLGIYEGVQDSIDRDPHYWHPDPSVPDEYKSRFGFPAIPGLLPAAIAPFTTAGLAAPWYSVYGNHDGLRQGNAPGVKPGNLRAFDSIGTGSVKPIGLAPLVSPADLEAAFANPAVLAGLLTAAGAPVRAVTPDVRRAAISADQWISAHLASPATPGPVGHGYTEDMLGTNRLYYTFPVAPGVLGVSMDSVNHGGYADGSIGAEQLAWLEARLVEVHGRFYDTAGVPVRTANTDQLVILFSHHNIGTMANPIPDPDNPTDRRHTADDLVALLRRFPNVIAWVNGHTHVNRVNPVPDPTGQTGGFWEITTAAHVDWPEHARLIEVVDNRDGTLSIFGVVVDHAGSAAADHTDLSVFGLAAISRELAANDPQTDPVAKLGAPTDLNVELLLAAPFSN